MARRFIIGVLLVCIVSLLVGAQEMPIVVQPSEAGYSPDQMTALEAALDRLQSVIGSTKSGSRKELGSGGWTLEKFAAYTAGTLERLGYQVAIVSRQLDEYETQTWVLVRVDLGGAIAWIPVEPLPDIDAYQRDLGDVPLVASLIYESSYLSYDAVIELPTNIPPTAVIRPPKDAVETEQSPWFGNTSTDPDGEIILLQWTFGKDVRGITHIVSEWYAFDVGGKEYPVSLTVTDSRGAQATTTTTVYVLTIAEDEALNCGCGG